MGFHEVPLTVGPTIVVGRKGSSGEVNFSPSSVWPIDTTYFVDARCTNQDLRWLTYLLASLGLNQLNRAAAVPGLNREDAYRKMLLLPPLTEQRRIAAILDQADALKAKRRVADWLVRATRSASFRELFGSMSSSRTIWPTAPLGSLLAEPMRNGTSPSSHGIRRAQVLTLTAVTGEDFDCSATKTAYFAEKAGATAELRDDLFLVCRGNGNKKLVGRGQFPSRYVPGTLFPDTIIALRINQALVERHYVAALWREPTVRGQIESGAHTTNGTWKINQTVLEGLEIPLPPLVRQREFSRRMRVIEKLGKRQGLSLQAMNALFASLQHRAFRGEL